MARRRDLDGRARELGFDSYRDVRDRGGFGRLSHLRRRAALEDLPESARESRAAAQHALADVRAGYGLDEAAARWNTSPEAVRAWVGDALDRAADRLPREIVVIGREGPVDVVVRGSRSTSLAAAHASAVGHYLAMGDRRMLAEFRGRRVAGVRLETRPAVLTRLAREGELEVEALYR